MLDTLWPGVIVVVVLCVDGVGAVCPHSDSSLKPWSESSTWSPSTKPVAGAQVILSAGMHVLLDENTPRLGSITIEAGAKLVWADKDDIKLTASYILVHGEFHMGSDDCRLERKANILLTGLSNSSLHVPGFGRKFLGVAAGGVIELHGRQKIAWTKLAKSVPAAHQTCGLVYNHKDTVHVKETNAGLMMSVWNTDGTLYDWGHYYTAKSWAPADTDQRFVDHLNRLPQGKIVAIAVHTRLGLAEHPEFDWESMYKAVEAVGGIARTKFRDAMDGDAYAFITMTGSSQYTKEDHKPIPKSESSVITDNVHVTLWDEKLKFFVESGARNVNDWTLPNTADFIVASTDVAYPKIEVIDNVRPAWKTGDKIVIASSDFDWRQAEEFKIYECTDCASNQFRVEGLMKYAHYGKIYDNVDMRAEVAMLSREIVIEGEMEDSCYVTDLHKEKEEDLCRFFKFDHFGGHFKMVKNFKDAHIQGIEFYHMGQQAFVGSYPIHFHMCDSVQGSWVRSNSIHKTLARCFTIHGTDYLEVKDNACWDHLGHGYFLEDSVERWNVIDGNLGMGTKHGTHILTDMKSGWTNSTNNHFTDALSTFWITHFENYIRNNVAAGSDNTGFWLLNSNEPLGPSKIRQAQKEANGEPAVTKFSARSTPILQFENNVAHSNARRGFNLDHRISNGEYFKGKWAPENGRLSNNAYVPREGGDPKGKVTSTKISRVTCYKNKRDNFWLRTANTVVEDSASADSVTGMTLQRSKGNTYTEVKNSVFIGLSDNYGLGVLLRENRHPGPVKPVHQFDRSFGTHPGDPIIGYTYYTGPNYVTGCYFNDFYLWRWNTTWDDEFGAAGYTPMGALGFRRGNMLVFTPQSQASGVKFGFCDDDGNRVFEGNTSIRGFQNQNEDKILATIHDEDGSVTGQARSQVVLNHPFLASPRCSFRSQWGVTVCPYKYARVGIRSDIWKTSKDPRPVTFIRDDAHQDPFNMKASEGSTYHFMLNKTYTVHFKGAIPKDIRLTAENLEKGDFLRFGVCVPKDMTSFSFGSSFPVRINSNLPPTEVGSIDDLDTDTTGKAYFWDKTIGMMFFKLTSTAERTDRNICPGGACPHMQLNINDGTETPDCLTSAYGPYIKAPEAATGEMDPPPCNKGTSQGSGAGETRPTTATLSTTTEDIFCPGQHTAAAAPLMSQSRGCSKDKSLRDLPHAPLTLVSAMTPGFCVNRCKDLSFRYAALQYGRECTCGNSFGAYGGLDECNMPCTGDKESNCGDSWRNHVYATGLVDETPMTKCGPGSRGVVIDDRCFYLEERLQNFLDAQRGCVMMGGDLATIQSEDVQDTLKAYLGKGYYYVWIGLTDVATEGEYVFMDGTSPTFLHEYVAGYTQGQHNVDFVAMKPSSGYRWGLYTIGYEFRSLCQIPLDASTTAVSSCGSNSLGNKIGSGSCYMVVSLPMNHQTAEYYCYTRQGVLATYTDAATQQEIRNQILRFGAVNMDYWTSEKGTGENFMELTRGFLYHKAEAPATTKNGFVCAIGSSATCPEGWQEHDSSCYLYTGRSAEDWDSAAALCNQGDSGLVTVHSKSENDFVYNMVKDFHDGQDTDVLLGCRYRSSADMFDCVGSATLTYTNWETDQQGIAGLSQGHCAKMTTSASGGIVWNNTPCVGQQHAVVCKLLV